MTAVSQASLLSVIAVSTSAEIYLYDNVTQGGWWKMSQDKVYLLQNCRRH